MYISKIDELIDSSLDNFFVFFILTNKNTIINKIKGEVNFVKFQLQINQYIEDFINIIKRYIAYYVFLSISFFYTGSESSFISNLMEFSKNQSTLNFKIANFF